MSSTSLHCLSYMQNQKVQDPCTVARLVGQLCDSQYNVSLADFHESNYVPNTTTANNCTCSWTIYNLISACSYCVGQTNYTNWGTWVTNCGGHLSNDSYFPPGLGPLPGIPFWATTNPSNWTNGVFNVMQASSIASGDPTDVTAVPTSTPTSTSTVAASRTGVSVGAVVGGVIGAIAIISIGVLIVFLAIRRCRRTSKGVTSFTASQVTTSPPSIRNRTLAQPTPFGYAYVSPVPLPARVASPTHSTTSLVSPLTSPISSGFSSQGHSVVVPISDAADMISPFLMMSPTRPTNKSSTSLSRADRAADVQSERAMSPSSQRARLNPPPYSVSPEPGPSRQLSAAVRRLSMRNHKRRNDSVSGTTTTTTHSGHSRSSTKESVSTFHAGPQTGQGRPRAPTPGAGTAESATNASSAVGQDGSIAKTLRGERVNRRPPAV